LQIEEKKCKIKNYILLDLNTVLEKVMLKKSDYSNVIWDWNGTIFDDVNLCVDIINNLLRKRGLKTLSVEEYKNIFTFPVKSYYEKLGFDFSKESFEIIGREWMDEYERRKFEASPFPDALLTIEKFQKMGIKQSVLSAYSLHTLKQMLKHFNLIPFFEEVKGLDNIYAGSKLELGKGLIYKLNLNGTRALLIGDTLHDAEVAVELGIDSVLITRGHQSKKALLKAGVPLYDSLEEMTEEIFKGVKVPAPQRTER
jgi:phosphoglycolate phosphatase